MEIPDIASASAVSPTVATAAEREVADLLPINVNADMAHATVAAVPFWFHTFALNRVSGIYTPGAARDHRYRVGALPQDLTGLSVLDVGTFDGFYAFLSEHRGAREVLAIDNEQYASWVAARWGVHLRGGEGFRAIQRLLGSKVEYRQMDAFDLADVDRTFDVIFCFGILHRVENPLGLLRLLRQLVTPHGCVLIETYGVKEEAARQDASIRVAAPGEVYERDAFVYWGFGRDGLSRLADIAGFARSAVLAETEIAGHPRIISRLTP